MIHTKGRRVLQSAPTVVWTGNQTYLLFGGPKLLGTRRSNGSKATTKYRKLTACHVQNK